MNRPRVALASFVTVLGLAASGAATAATHTVPGAYSTIQEAIDRAADGDTISVRPGIYYENLVLRGRSLTMRSTRGPAQTIIDGGRNGPVVLIVSGGRSTIDGFTIQNGLGTGQYAGGIAVHQEVVGSVTSVSITNSIITRNEGAIAGGVSKYCTPYPTPGVIDISLTDSAIINNTGTSAGGLFSLGYGWTRIATCTVANNTSTKNGGGVVGEYLSGVDIENSFITGNSAGGSGGGVYFHTIYSDMHISNSVVELNTAGVAGGGIVAGYGGGTYPLALNHTTVTRNTAPQGGGFVQEVGRAVNGSDNVIYGNSTPASFLELGSVSLQYSDVEGGLSGSGNIDADPLFVNPAARNYQLGAGSPAIDAGVIQGGIDMLGVGRPQGASSDMGAYEVVPPDTVPPVSTAAVTGTAGTNGWYTSAVTVTIHATDDRGVREVHCSVNGAETIVPGPDVLLPITSDGTYAITFFAVDDAGNAEAGQSLSVGVDATAPAVGATNPANNATGVNRSALIAITFSENVAPGSAYSGVVLKRGSTIVATTRTLSGNALTVTPSTPLNATTTYAVTVPAGAVVDAAGNSPAAPYSFTFRTGAN